MPAVRELIFLLPDYELEGYPRSLPSEDSARLLSGWLAMWHPALIAAAETVAHWQSSGQLTSDVDGKVIFVPEIAREHVSEESLSRIRQLGYLIEATGEWQADQHSTLTALGISKGDVLAGELTPTFTALGYAYLQVQLMTRQLRYTSNLDKPLFGSQATGAAKAAMQGDRETAERLLQACFDTLGQERDHYYSLDVNLLDVTLLASSTLGNALERQLENPAPTSLLSSASVLQKLRDQSPERFRKLQQRIQEHSMAVAGGLDIERPHPLMARDAVARDFMRGKEAYRTLDLKKPSVFGRFSFGFTANSATLIRRNGYEGALLVAWSGGKYPQGSQAKASWEATDGTYVSALATQALDAADPSSFLSLGWSIGEALDHQHVPTVVFAHWPGKVCPLYDLLSIIAERTPALGKWSTIDTYFVETDKPYHQERFEQNGFVYNWLTNAESPSALIARTFQHHRLCVRLRSLQNLANLVVQLEKYGEVPKAVETPEEGVEVEPKVSEEQSDYRALEFGEWRPDLAEAIAIADSLFDESVSTQLALDQAGEIMRDLKQEVLGKLSRLVQHEKQTAKVPNQELKGRVIFNPASVPVRLATRTQKDLAIEDAHDWHFATGRSGEQQMCCVDVPAMGFVVAPVVKSPSKPISGPVLATAGGLLQSEFLEAQIDVARGHLRSLHVPQRRGNRLSVMLAYRENLGKDQAFHSSMVAQDLSMLTSSNVRGLIRTRGRLEDDNGIPLGKFEIDYDIDRGSRILGITVRLSELRPLVEKDPWKSAYVLRVAWPTEAALLRNYCNGYRNTWAGNRAIAPELIEIDEAEYATHYLTGGLAFHRRTEMRFLETILASGEQREVEHRVGIGVDLPSPLLAARQFQDQAYEVDLFTSPTAMSGWMVSCDNRHVSVDLERPLVNAEGRLVGIRVFVAETKGISCSVNIRLLRDVREAHRVDYDGQKLSQIKATGDRLAVSLRANEQANIDVLWQ